MNPNDPAVVVAVALVLGLAGLALTHPDWLRLRQAAAAVTGVFAVMMCSAGAGLLFSALWVALAFCVTDFPREPDAPWMVTPGRGASLPGSEPGGYPEYPGDGGDRQA